MSKYECSAFRMSISFCLIFLLNRFLGTFQLEAEEFHSIFWFRPILEQEFAWIESLERLCIKIIRRRVAIDIMMNTGNKIK